VCELGRALGVFASFDTIWASKKMRLQSKMRVYTTFVLPHFLYGCKTWAPTKAQLTRLETAHAHCLRRILGRGPHRPAQINLYSAGV
jgi:hypothetical protein